MASNVPSLKKTTRLSTSKTEKAAVWAMERWDQRPSLSYTQMVAEVRRHFGIGKTAGEQAIKRANELFREHAATLLTQERIAKHLHRLAENAERAGDSRTAARIYESIARVTGVAAAEKVEDVTERPLNTGELTTEQLDALAALED